MPPALAIYPAPPGSQPRQVALLILVWQGPTVSSSSPYPRHRTSSPRLPPRCLRRCRGCCCCTGLARREKATVGLPTTNRIRALHLLSGKDSAGSVKGHLRRLAASFHCDVTVTLVDKQLGRRYDLNHPKVRQRYLDLVDQGFFDMIFMSPPCATFSIGRRGLTSRGHDRRGVSLNPVERRCSRLKKETGRLLATFLLIFAGVWLSWGLRARLA